MFEFIFTNTFTTLYSNKVYVYCTTNSVYHNRVVVHDVG